MKHLLIYLFAMILASSFGCRLQPKESGKLFPRLSVVEYQKTGDQLVTKVNLTNRSQNNLWYYGESHDEPDFNIEYQEPHPESANIIISGEGPSLQVLAPGEILEFTCVTSLKKGPCILSLRMSDEPLAHFFFQTGYAIEVNVFIRP
jgi:hypothetical protein